MPLTVQRNTSYDAKIRHAQTKGIIMNILGLLALIDIIHDWWVLQNNFLFLRTVGH